MKNYRPHILVAIILAVALLSGWNSGLRNVLADLRFHWKSHHASGDVVVVAIDAPSIEKIGVWPQRPERVGIIRGGLVERRQFRFTQVDTYWMAGPAPKLPPLSQRPRHAWIQVVKGHVSLNGENMKEGDGAGISSERELSVSGTGSDGGEILLFDLA